MDTKNLADLIKIAMGKIEELLDKPSPEVMARIEGIITLLSVESSMYAEWRKKNGNAGCCNRSEM